MTQISDLANARVIVIGDVMIDRYVHGHWSKIGGEGLPVFRETHREDRPGGAGNVAAQLEALGCHVTLFGKPPHSQPVKTRFFDRAAVFRSDAEYCYPLDGMHQRAIVASLEASSGYHALVISDYAKGVCTPALCREAISWARGRSMVVVVDPKGGDWSKYGGAHLFTPNQAEWDAAMVVRYNRLSIDVLVTQAARGMEFCSGRHLGLHIPATGPRVVDVTGAGDTVTAVCAAAMAVGFDIPTAARLANAAAGVTVGKLGTATCSLKELEDAWSLALQTAASTDSTTDTAISCVNAK